MWLDFTKFVEIEKLGCNSNVVWKWHEQDLKVDIECDCLQIWGWILGPIILILSAEFPFLKLYK